MRERHTTSANTLTRAFAHIPRHHQEAKPDALAVLPLQAEHLLPADYKTPGLGGSEASLVVLTRTLASRGHSVEVFNCCYKPGVYDGVRWRMLWEREDAGKADVAVAVRYEESLCPDPSRASTHLFWMLDERPGGANLFAERFRDHGEEW
jgi:hypothetical protein